MRLPPPVPLASFLLVVAAAALSGCSGGASTWHGRDLDQQNPPWYNATLEPGWSLRWDVVANSQTDVPWDWFVEDRLPLSYALYRHDPDGLTELHAIHATDDKGQVLSQYAGLHSHVWTNDSAQTLEFWVRVGTPVGGGYYSPDQDPKSDVCRTTAAALC